MSERNAGGTGRRKRRRGGSPNRVSRASEPARAGNRRTRRTDGARDPRTAPQPAFDPNVFCLRYCACSHALPPSWSEIRRTLQNLDGMLLDSGSAEQGQPCFRYLNLDTGVEACFRGYLTEVPDEVGLTFEMNLPRPGYFAHEALPLAVMVARELRLDTRPHGPDGPTGSPHPSKEGLLTIWLEQNTQARKNRGPAPAARADELEATWEYLTLREELFWRYGRRGVAVPRVEFVRRRKTGEVLRMCRWARLAPSIFPPVDLVYLEDPPPPLKDGRILSFDQLSQAAHRWLRYAPQPIYHRTYLETSPSEELLGILATLKARTMRSYESVAVEDLDEI
jgi:hypothetical protein